MVWTLEVAKIFDKEAIIVYIGGYIVYLKSYFWEIFLFIYTFFLMYNASEGRIILYVYPGVR